SSRAGSPRRSPCWRSSPPPSLPRCRRRASVPRRADGRLRAEGPSCRTGPGGQWRCPFAAPRPAGDALEGAPMTASDIDRRIADLPVAVDLTEDAVILEVDLSGTGAQIWEHLTDPELLATWSPIVPERPLTEPGPVLSRETPEAEPVAVDVLATAGDHALTHRWGDELLEWLIDEARLTLLMRLSDPQQAPSHLAGWQVCLGVLDARLEGEDQARIVGREALEHGWEALRDRYAEELDLPAQPAG